MAVTGEHFVGFDPTQGLSQFAFCPRSDLGAVMVWFEQWAFTGWSKGNKTNTGIVYNHCYGTFDMLGNLISTAPICGPQCCGFTGNATAINDQRVKTPEEWLDEARERTKHCKLPPPGTIEICPKFLPITGIR
jgi:hypothetical protein